MTKDKVEALLRATQLDEPELAEESERDGVRARRSPSATANALGGGGLGSVGL